jgi:hypothetical protein
VQGSAVSEKSTEQGLLLWRVGSRPHVCTVLRADAPATPLLQIVMRDRITGKPRGFGFITFEAEAAAKRACEDTHHLDGRTVRRGDDLARNQSVVVHGQLLGPQGSAAACRGSFRESPHRPWRSS